MQEFKKCPFCGKGKLVKKVTEEVFNYKGKTITIPDYVIHECNVCGESIVNRKTLKSAGKKLKEFKNQQIEKLQKFSSIRKATDFNPWLN
jgi:YgiT-type zinc finger domain-containing protein